MPLSIRPARPEDFDAILEVAARAWEPVFAAVNVALGSELAERLHGPDWRVHHAAEVKEILESLSGTTWLAQVDDTLVGFASARIVDPRRGIGEVTIVGVDPASQQAGIGAALTRHAERWLRGQGAAVAFIGTGGDAGHAPARRLYESLGYRGFPVVQYYKVLGDSAEG